MTRQWVARGPALEDFALVDTEVRAPGPGEVTIVVDAAGVNPADLKHVRRAGPEDFPIPVGYEIAGVISAVGPDTEIASGPATVGEPVVAFRVHGGYADAMTTAARDVFALPDGVDPQAAAGLLLAGATAAEMLDRSAARAGETVLLHGASGTVGALFLQLAGLSGVRVIGTAGTSRLDAVTRFGGYAVPYGPGLLSRVREGAPDGVVAALDAAGTDEAMAVSLDTVADRRRIITVAAPGAAAEYGVVALSGANRDSAAYRDGVRARLIALLGDGSLTVPLAQSFPLADAPVALDLVVRGDAHGKVVLVP